MPPPRLYLDNAATSFPKPPAVHEAMLRYATQVGGTAGRGNYREAREGARVINQCRARLCEFFNGESPAHVIFTLNTTDALNLAIKGIVSARLRRDPRRPLHLVTTSMDHNSVLRPFNALAARGDVEWTCVDVDDQTGLVDPADIQAALRPDTALVAIIHASNVTGVIQPIAEIGATCRARAIPFLVDAAQSLGHIPVDVRAMNIDLLAFPGHKGLLGPLGTGGLYIRPGLENGLDPVREGGTGSRSEDDTQPATLPDKYEPGSQNAVGIAGLSEAVAWHLESQVNTGSTERAVSPVTFATSPERSEGNSSPARHFVPGSSGTPVRSLTPDHERNLIETMLDGLAELDTLGPTFGRRGLRLIGPITADGRVGVFSLIHESLSPHELAAIMEQEYGILGRAGLHCAPRAHAALGTMPAAGAYRLSPGPFNTVDDVRLACRALGEITGPSTPDIAIKPQTTLKSQV